jgi:hypothetical protein
MMENKSGKEDFKGSGPSHLYCQYKLNIFLEILKCEEINLIN